MLKRSNGESENKIEWKYNSARKRANSKITEGHQIFGKTNRMTDKVD